MNNHRKKQRALWQLCGIIALLLFINIGFSFVNGKIDLTHDKRYTITPATKNLLRHLPEKVKATVFLDGANLPAAFRRLSRTTMELLRNFREISNNKVSFQSLDPLGDDSTAMNLLKTYHMSGIPVTINDGKKGTIQRMIFPWALVSLEGTKGETQSFPVFLQVSNTPQLSRSVLLQSEMLLEYNIANAIHQITKKKISAVAYLTGNGEAFGYHVYAAFRAINKYYRLDTFNLKSNGQIPKKYDAVILNRPEKPFSEIDLFKLDQYIMHGGRLFINVDGATGALDSFHTNGQFNAYALKLNLDNFLYHYGVRLNHDLLLDAVDCAGIPLMAKGVNPKPTIYPWVYFPVLQPGSDNPIVKNLNGVLGRFVSTLDTNANNPDIEKTILLCSSNYSKIAPTPTPVLLESASVQKNPATFLKKKLVAAVLLQGKFQSVFANRSSESLDSFIRLWGIKPLLSADTPTGIIVASDGALMKNEFSQKEGPSDLGVYRFSDYRFDNKAFLLNCLAYLTDPDNLLQARAKSFEKHLLDPKRTTDEREQWQFLNIAIPIVAIILLGMIFFFVRKKKYG